MNEDRKKALRTQGRYSDDFKKKRNEKDKKTPPRDSDSASMKSEVKRQSFADILKESVKYTENSASSMTFEKLSSKREPIEIKTVGEHVLSESPNGISRIFYEPAFMDEDEAMSWFLSLYEEIPFDERNIVIRGIEHPQPRLVAWYGPYPYTYSGLTLKPAEIPESVIQIKRKVEQHLRSCNLNVELNSVLINLYEHGHHSIAWHSDDELTMGVQPTIASVSLGESRKFQIRKKPHLHGSDDADNQADYYINLTNGSLLIMDGCMQKDWQHRVPKEYHDRKPRINLTFRTVYALDKLPVEVVPKCLDKIQESNKSLTKETEYVTDDNVERCTSEVPSVETNKDFKSDLSTHEVDDFSCEQTKLDNSSEFPLLNDNKNSFNMNNKEEKKIEANADPNINSLMQNPADMETTQRNIQDKSVSADLMIESASNASFSDNHTAIENCPDRGIKPNSRKPCPPFSNTNHVMKLTSLNVNAIPFVPKCLPAFSEKPCDISKGPVQNPEDDFPVVPDKERPTNTTPRRQHLSKRLLDIFQNPYDAKCYPVIIEEISSSLTCPLFSVRDKKELQFLCDISEDQTSENQAQISIRIQEVVLEAMEVSMRSESGNRMRNSMSVQNEPRNRMRNSVTVQNESSDRVRNYVSAQNGLKSRFRTELRQSVPPRYNKSASPRHQQQWFDKRNDAVHKEQ